MDTYKRHRFPPETISYAVWLYYRFNLSHRDVEDLLAQRGIIVSYESIRLWCIKFGAKFAKRLKRKLQGYGDSFYLDEVFVKIQGKQHYLWRAVDQDGEVVDVFLQRRRDTTAAKRFFKRLLRSHGQEPRMIVSDKPGSYVVAHRAPKYVPPWYDKFFRDRMLGDPSDRNRWNIADYIAVDYEKFSNDLVMFACQWLMHTGTHIQRFSRAAKAGKKRRFFEGEPRPLLAGSGVENSS